jgi:hypothetical protein
VQLKREIEFIWGDAQREAFERIKDYLTKPPVLRALENGKAFRIYITAHERVIGAMLT